MQEAAALLNAARDAVSAAREALSAAEVAARSAQLAVDDSLVARVSRFENQVANVEDMISDAQKFLMSEQIQAPTSVTIPPSTVAPRELRHAPEKSITWLEFHFNRGGDARPTAATPLSRRKELLMTSGADGHIKIWDPRMKEPLQDFVAGSDGVNMATFSPDGNSIAAASNGSTVRIYDLATGNASNRPLSKAYAEHRDSITWVAFDSQSEFVVSASADHFVRCFAERTLSTFYYNSPRLPKIPTAVTISPNFNHVTKTGFIVSAADDGRVRVHYPWELPRTPWESEPLNAPARRPSLSADGLLLIASSGAGFAKVWKINGDRPASLVTLEHLSKANKPLIVFHAIFSPQATNGAYRVATGASDGVVRLFQLSKPKEPVELSGHRSAVRYLAWHPDRPFLASGDADGGIIVWNTDTGKAMTRLTGYPQKDIFRLAFSPDGKWLAACGRSDFACLWESKAWGQE